MIDFKIILNRIKQDPNFQSRLDYGEVRLGHPEGTVRKHIVELEANLEKMKNKLLEQEQDKLRLLILVHDAFKGDAKRGVSIIHPESHASLSSKYLKQFCPEEEDLLRMVQVHDEPYSLFKKFNRDGFVSESRLSRLVSEILDWDLFFAFLIIDSCTEGKSRSFIWWFLEELKMRLNQSGKKLRWTMKDIL